MAKPSTTPPPMTAAEFAANLSNRFLHCRELGHTWRAHTVSWDAEARAYDRRLRCSGCHTIRIQLLDAYGHVVANRYQYPDNYLAHRDGQVGALGGARDAFRLEAITRFLTGSSGIAGAA
jgi:hypothetical protein